MPDMSRPQSFRTTVALAVAWMLCCLLLFPATSHSQFRGAIKSPQKKAPETAVPVEQGEWELNAGNITYDQETTTYVAEGSVRMQSGDRIIQADWASLNTQNHQVELKGNVFLQYGKNWLKGEHVFWNLQSEAGWIEQGTIFFAENSFYVKGNSIEKTGPQEYLLHDGSITSCDPNDPDWQLKYKTMKVTTNGVAWAKDTSVWAKMFPVFYTPIIAMPVQDKRQSGFLIPWAGYSKLNGYEAELPFYWAIRDDMDATIYGRGMEKRGFMAGAEYRVANPKYGEGIWQFNYLSDQGDKNFLTSQGYPPETTDRYWLRARHSLNLPADIEARLDLDIVSDKFFLQEFTRGSSSYGFSNAAFLGISGRGILNDQTSLIRESTLYLDKRTESTLLSLDIRYFQQLDKTLENFALERLPALSYSVIPSWIGSTPLYYTMGSSFVNYWRKQGDSGQRLDFYPRAYYPLHWNNYLDVEPSVGVRGDAYHVDWDNSTNGPYQGRFLSDARLEMSSRMNRVFPVQIGDAVAVEHSIRPTVVYEYVPRVNQDKLPHFDMLDVNQSRNDIRYGLTNFITAKQVSKDIEGNPVTTYREVARLEVFQAYNFEKSDVEDIQFGSPGTGFTSVGMRLDVMPHKYVTLSYDTNLYSSEGTSAYHDVYLTLNSGKGQMMRLDYQYRADLAVNEVIATVILKVLSNFYLTSYHDYSIEQQTMYKQGYGVRYVHGCWGMGLMYEKEQSDHRVAFTLDLLGLGGFGRRFPYRIDDSLGGLNNMSAGNGGLP